MAFCNELLPEQEASALELVALELVATGRAEASELSMVVRKVEATCEAF